MKSLLTRTISGLIIVILTITAVKLSSIYLAGYVFLLSIIGMYEFYNAVEKKDIKPIKLVGYLSCVGFLLDTLGFSWISVSYILIFDVILLLLYSLIRKDKNISDIAITFLGVLYIPVLFQHIIYLSDSIYIWLVFIIAWGTDTCAYIFGMIFGKHKLCPKLSPKKTIEGSIGGILGSVALVYLYIRYFKLTPTWVFILLSFIGSIVAQIGDLTASKIKRITGIKDFGFIMPGHGGILDRFDSILFIAPYTYYLLNYFL